jgi:hypothetical protein
LILTYGLHADVAGAAARILFVIIKIEVGIIVLEI